MTNDKMSDLIGSEIQRVKQHSITFGTPSKDGAFKWYFDTEEELKLGLKMYKVFLQSKIVLGI